MQKDQITRFWDKYIEKTISYGVKPVAARWYVKRVEAYIKAYPDLRIVKHTERELEKYLHALGRKSGLEDWQFTQIIDALRILFQDVLKLEWSLKYRWDDWSDAVTGLSVHHATVAKDISPDEFIEVMDVDLGNLESNKLLRDVCRLYPGFVKALLTRIRVTQYSIRTERGYLNWMARFLHFSVSFPQ